MAERMRIVMTGATGVIGQRLYRALRSKGHQLVIFSRSPERAKRSLPDAVEHVAWNAEQEGPWAAAIDGADVIINMAGAPIVGKRWTKEYKEEIRRSRVDGTRGLVNAIEAAAQRPRALINASAIGYYGDRGDEELTEASSAGEDYLGQLCVAWEAEALRAQALGARVALVRTGVVLDDEGGALPLMSRPFKFFVGGPLGSGNQWLSWIHRDDELGLLLLALEDERVSGPLNAVAPQPRTNRDFSLTMARVLGRPSYLPVPAAALRLIMGEAAAAVLGSQRVLPAKAQELGYQFEYTHSAEALRDLLLQH